jgi:hypothetical protein
MKLVDRVGYWAQGFGIGVFLSLTIADWGQMLLRERMLIVALLSVMLILIVSNLIKPFFLRTWLDRKLHRANIM